ncbi:unnamed protein product [Bathycoccus prasinos]
MAPKIYILVTIQECSEEGDNLRSREENSRQKYSNRWCFDHAVPKRTSIWFPVLKDSRHWQRLVETSIDRAWIHLELTPSSLGRPASLEAWTGEEY